MDLNTHPAAAPSHPAPVADIDSGFFWAALREHRLVLQQCSACARMRFPPMPTCPYCACTESERREPSGRGTVYSSIVVRRAFAPVFEPDVPYTLVTVQIDEGCRIVGRLEGDVSAAMGMPLRASFFDHEDWTELRFVPEPPSGGADPQQPKEFRHATDEPA